MIQNVLQISYVLAHAQELYYEFICHWKVLKGNDQIDNFQVTHAILGILLTFLLHGL